MAIKCAQCGKKIPDGAPACPSCGAAMIPAPANPPRTKRVTYTPPRRKHLTPRKLAAVLVLIGVECLVFWRWGSIHNDKTASTATAFAAPTSPPSKVVHEHNQLKEGQSTTYSFTLSSDARVHVEVTATPKPVDVLLMSSNEAAKFQAVQGKFFALGSQYTYRQTLSALDVLTMDKTDILPQGNWVIVITHPKESILFAKDTAASMVLTIY